jgi:DNA-binding response OmpR family regulator
VIRDGICSLDPWAASAYQSRAPRSAAHVRQASLPHSPNIFSTACSWEMMPLRTILLVDDDPDLLEVVAATLAEPGYTVLTATDGYEAVRILVDRAVDFLVTDVQMPGISGFELRQAKLMRPNLHVIYLSGWTSKSDRLGPTYGVLVRKPVRGRDLLAMIEGEIGRAAASGPTPNH